MMDSLHRRLSQKLLSYFFYNRLKVMIDSLRSFDHELSIEDEQDKTYTEFVEKITEIIANCHEFLAWFDDSTSLEVAELRQCIEAANTELKVQRGEIYHAAVTGVSTSRFREVFGVVQQRLLPFAGRIENALQVVENALISTTNQCP